MSGAPITSHGRGGAGNIAADETPYTDGEIVREGSLGDQGDGPYSTGRGGAGNIDSPRLRPSDPSTSSTRNRSTSPGDVDVIPETAIKAGQYDNYHVGRGGEGNVHKEKHHNEGGKEHEGLAAKAKHLLGGHSEKKEHEGQ